MATSRRPRCKQVIAPLVASGWYFATVESVTDAGVQPVFSIRVDSDDHAFLAAGFVNHNTESRLAPLAMQLLGEIDEDTVDFTPTYDGNTVEPVVLPARFPNLLVNGGGGIAVGMATNIPPHNLGEVIDAVQHLLDHPDASVTDLMQFVKGPDFPSGALILGRSGIHDAYTTGRGSIKMRAVAEIEEGRKGDMRIVVTQVPYQTSVEVIGQKIAELVNDRKIEGIRDVRNESSGDTTRLVVELKRDANAQVVLNLLYKHTPMQTNFPVHMLALVDNVPKLLDLKTALAVYIEHQKESHPAAHRVPPAQGEGARAHRRGPGEGARHDRRHHRPDPGRRRRRRRPRRPDGRAVRVHRDPGATTSSTCSCAASPSSRARSCATSSRSCGRPSPSCSRSSTAPGKLAAVIKAELAEVRDKFADERRTELTSDVGDLDVLDLIDDEEVIVVLSSKGYIKTVAADAFRRQGRGGRGVRGGNLRDEDFVAHLLTTTAHSYLLFFSNRGKSYRLARARDPDEGAHRARHRARSTCCRSTPTSASRRSSTPAPTRTARSCSSPPRTAW